MKQQVLKSRLKRHNPPPPPSPHLRGPLYRVRSWTVFLIVNKNYYYSMRFCTGEIWQSIHMVLKQLNEARRSWFEEWPITRGVLTNKGRLPPRSNPLRSILYTIFDRQGTTFVYLPLTNGTPFTYCKLPITTPLKPLTKLYKPKAYN